MIIGLDARWRGNLWKLYKLWIRKTLKIPAFYEQACRNRRRLMEKLIADLNSTLNKYRKKIIVSHQKVTFQLIIILSSSFYRLHMYIIKSRFLTFKYDISELIVFPHYNRIWWYNVLFMHVTYIYYIYIYVYSNNFRKQIFFNIFFII